MNNKAFQQGIKEACNPQIVSSPSGSISQFTEETSSEEQQTINALSENDKFIKNQQLFLAIRKKKTYEEKIRKIDKYLEKGADIDAIDKNHNYNTPLHVAVLNCEPEIVSALLDRRALIHAKNSNGETPVDIAKRLQYQSIIEIFQARTTPHHISVKEKPISTSHIETRINFNQDNEVENNPQQRVTKRSGAQGLHGQIYQLKLLMLFLKRGLDKKYSFRLATENKEYKKFDDLFFEIINKDGKKEYRLLQSKHKTDNFEKITLDSLLTLSDSDYSLVKYFFSYYDLKKKLVKKGIIRDVTVCTNIDFDLDKTFKENKIRDIVETIDNSDDILNFESNASVTSKRYHFKKEIVPLLKPLLLTYNLTRLAEELADCIVKNNGMLNYQPPFQDYHIILAEEVIDTKNKIFFNEFINGSELSGEAETFREVFKEIICKKLPGLCFRNINQLFVNSKLCFKLSKKFGYSKINQNWPENSEDVKELAKNFIHNVLKAEIINTKGPFKLYHAVLAKEVIDTQENKFFDQFVNGEGISEDAKRFRNALESESELQGKLSLKEIDKAVIDNINGKGVHIILSKKFGKEEKNKESDSENNSADEGTECRYQGNSDLDEINQEIGEKKSWPKDSISDEDINDFLDHLVFAVNQPNEDELGKIIENDIGQDFNFVAKYYVYNELFVRMLNWLNGKGEEYISYEDGKRLFDDIKSNRSELELTSISQEHQDELKKYDINFKETFDSELCNFLKLSDTNIFHVITKDVTLSAIKVYTILASIPECNYCYNYIFMKFNSVLRQQDRVERALKIPKNVFVIICETASKDIHQQYNQLFNIMKSSNSKSTILISHENDSIDQNFKADSFFKNKYNEVIDGSIKFSDLSTDSQTNLLETRAIIFQGKKISLNKLITDDDSKDLIEPEVLFMLISNMDVKIVGNTSSNLDAMDHYFMNRKLYSCEIIEESFKKEKEFYFTYNSNIETSHFEKNQDIVLISDSLEHFRELCSTYEKHNIHWIQIQDDKLVWMATRNKNSKISESHKFYFTYNSNIETSIEKNQDIFLISNSKDHFRELCSTYAKHNIHWIQKHDEELIWMATRNKNSKISESHKFYFTYSSNIETSRIEKHQDIVLISNFSEHFRQLCSTYETHNIHWIKKQDEEMIWIATRNKDYKISESHNSSQSRKKIKKNICWFFDDIIPPNLELFISKNMRSWGTEIKDITDNIVILSADPGMGKSTMLAYLAQQLKEFNPLLWVEIIDLRVYSGNLKKLKLPINLKDVIKFLLDIIGLKTHLEKELFKLRINKQGKIILLFDGFDEISPKWKEIVIELLHVLQNTKVERLWVATRPHLKNEIEDKLNASSYTLKPLSIQEQEIFLKKLFSQKFDISYTNEKCLGYYSDKVIDEFSKYFNKDIKFALDFRNYKLPEVRVLRERAHILDSKAMYNALKSMRAEYLKNMDSYEMKELIRRVGTYISTPLEHDPKSVLQLIGRKNSPEARLNEYTNYLLKTIPLTTISNHDSFFLGIPLHLSMLAEIFQDNFQDFLDSKQDKRNYALIHLKQKLRKNLHEPFLKKKYETYWKVKKNADLRIPCELEDFETSYRSWKLDLTLLAVSMLFDDREISILSEENKYKIDEIKRNIKDGKERAGIMRLTSNDTPTFLHHSFAEYLAAEYIYDKLKFFPSTDNLWSFLDKTIFTEDYKNMRRFFDHKLAKGNKLANLKFQSNSETFFEEHLYVATNENLLNIIQLILEIINRNSYLVMLFKKIFIRIVDVAFFKNHKVVEVLLKYAKCVDTDGIIENVTSKYVWKAVQCGHERMLDVLLKYIENSDLVVKILKSEKYFEINKVKFKVENIVYTLVDDHCLTANHALFKCIKKLNNDDRFNVLYSFEESIEPTDHHMYSGSKFSPMHRAKQMADSCDTCGEECQQYVDLCSLMDGIWEVHEYLINDSNLSPLEVAKLLSKVIEKDWNTANVTRVVLKTKSDTIKKCIINTKIDNDKTLFHLACGSMLQRRPASLSMIEFLVDHEADLNVQDKDGRTPLHFAVCACNGLEVVKYLVGKGADFTAVDSFGKTPLLLAEEKNNFEVVQYLVLNTIQCVLKILMEFCSLKLDTFLA